MSRQEEWPVTGPCFYTDMPDNVYHADPCPTPSLSGTTAIKLVQSGGPAKVASALEHGAPPPTQPMLDGTAIHSVVLGAGANLVPDAYLTASGKPSTKAEAKQWRTEQEKAGNMVMSPALLIKAREMAAVIHEHETISDLFSGGDPEVSVFSFDDTYQIWLRGRIDYLRDRKTVIDYKTTIDASPDGFNRLARNRGYRIQAAHYLRIAKSLDLIDSDARFIFVAQEKEPPYLAAAYQLSEEELLDGARKTELAAAAWYNGTQNNKWPGYPTGITTLETPPWAKQTSEEEVEAVRTHQLNLKNFDLLISESE